ncbi:hypothetical protein O6H91_11G055700 [Diphasiastrum complanatum]|uniref:Uncharacterized protein n=1 Tax=Diphasiastrum complanatum TaxID=34168 RepID=A0ACC2C9G1_DIPCM|nr:hypothetical protein O6H91_11G055700 [Diphasiastrum complanatum]
MLQNLSFWDYSSVFVSTEDINCLPLHVMNLVFMLKLLVDVCVPLRFEDRMNATSIMKAKTGDIKEIVVFYMEGIGFDYVFFYKSLISPAICRSSISQPEPAHGEG